MIRYPTEKCVPGTKAKKAEYEKNGEIYMHTFRKMRKLDYLVGPLCWGEWLKFIKEREQ